MMDGIKEIADGFGAELKRRLPKQRNTNSKESGRMACG
jgi:hypothetical protein